MSVLGTLCRLNSISGTVDFILDHPKHVTLKLQSTHKSQAQREEQKCIIREAVNDGAIVQTFYFTYTVELQPVLTPLSHIH